jgi:O-antigen biosynthesis protein WbqP
MKLYTTIKQILDTFFAVLLTIVLSPILLLLALLIRLDSSGPILFKQKRIGIHRSEFEIYKFRTMRSNTPKDVPTHLMKDPNAYITKLGRFLRKSSLDELPQLFNILKGEMSFVGPRPALWNQFDLIEAREQQKETYNISANDVKPGITGWAQINGRDELLINRKAELDGYYASRQSFTLDLKIIVLTILHVFTAKGVSEGGPKASN